MDIGFGIVFLAPILLEISPFSCRNIGRVSYFRVTWQQFVHWIERGRFSGYRFWNRVSIPYHSRDIVIFNARNRPRELFPDHVTTGSWMRYVLCIERRWSSGCRFLNFASIAYRFQDIDGLIFKGDFALESWFSRERGRNCFSKFWPLKGTSLSENTPFDIFSVEIG